MSAVKCPSCGSSCLFYVMASVETFSMEWMPVDGKVEMASLQSSDSLLSFEPYLSCDSCSKTFDLFCVEKPL